MNKMKYVLPVYGGKNSVGYVRGCFPLMPRESIKGFADCFVGGGGILANIGCGLGDIPKVAIDKDASIIAFYRAVQQKPLELMERLAEIEYSEEFYLKQLNIIMDYREGKYYSDVTVATAVYATICMARNGMRIKSYRSNVPNAKYSSDKKLYMQKERDLKGIQQKMYSRIPYVVHDIHGMLNGVQLLGDSALNHTYLWERAGWMCVCDVPYLYEKRGISDKRKSAGYLDDWQNEDHTMFLQKIVEMHNAGKIRANMWICSNFELVDGAIPLEQLREDPYVQALLPLGWRLAVVQEKVSSSIMGESQLKKTKKPKAEVLFINYLDIVGAWTDYTYYDYKDVFGQK